MITIVFFILKTLKVRKKRFNDALLKEFKKQKKLNEKYDFKGFVFPFDVSFQGIKFEKDIDFTKAQFSGDADFRAARFSGFVSFRAVQFHGKANFLRAQFYGNAVFLIVQFLGKAEFWGTNFFKNAGFSRSRFLRNADFSKSQFSRKVDFLGTQFFRKVDFLETQFSGNANFWGAHFAENSNFSTSQFYGNTSFWAAKFSGDAEFLKVHFYGKVDYRSAQFAGDAYFKEAQFSGYTNFVRTKFSEDANFDNIRLEKYKGCDFLDTYFYNVIGLFEFLERNKKKFKFSSKTEFLPDNFRLILGEEVISRYPITSRKIRDDMYLMSFKNKFPKLHFFWWLFADCGRSFLRWALWSLIFAVMFTLFYELIYYCSPSTFKADFISPSWSGISFLYYSIVTFTTLGFGDIVPQSPWVQMIVMIEVILGYIMLGGLISILANKLARRS